MLKQHQQKFEFMEFVRTTSVGCTQMPQENAHMYLKNGDLRSFVDIINNPDVEAGADNDQHWINQPIDDDQDNATLLEEAVKLRKYEFVSALVKVGALRDHVNIKTGVSPLHVACQLGDVKLLGLLLADDDVADPNVRASDRKGGFTPLHFAAQTRSQGHLQCLELLLHRDDVNVDMKDISNIQTPLFVAVESKNEPGVRALVQFGANLDVKCGKKTIREYIPDYLPAFDPRSVRVIKTRAPIENLEAKLAEMVRRTKINGENYKADFSGFRTFVRFIKSAEDNLAITEIFNLCCEKNLHEHAALLLQKGVDPNNKEKPILEVAYKGYHKVLAVLLKDSRTDLSVIKHQTRESILHLVLKMEFEQTAQEDYEKCWKLLQTISEEEKLNQIKGIINKKDGLGNTALHYATQKWNDSTVRNILEFGANIGIKNYWNEIPIAKIRPQTMEDFLDEHCLVHEGDTMHENFELSFKYGFLAPDPEALPEKYRNYGKEEESLMDNNFNKEVEALPETECLWYMGQSKDHRYLLKHPVITSFLWYKWQRIRKYFNRNLRLYILFVFLLTWFIFKEYGSSSSTLLYNRFFYFAFIVMFSIMAILVFRDFIYEINYNREMARIKHNHTNAGLDCLNVILGNIVEAGMIAFMTLIIVFGADLLKPGLTALLTILLCIEIFQLMVSIKRYFFQMENWVENATIALGFIILYNNKNEFEFNRNLAAIAIFLSWSRMITLIGKHPKNNHLNIYVTMFFKVLWSFFRFLSWYGLFIIAFGLSFFIMLHEDKEATVNTNQDDDEDKYEYFNTTFLSIVKTMTMFVGELEFSDIPINLDSFLMPVNYLFFLTFVFLIVVVLMNLLNGLAVSDTGVIQEQAEIYSYLSRVETISYLESVLLGDPFDFLSNVPRFLTFLPSCSVFRQLYRSNFLRKVFTKIGASNILLFFNYLPEKRSPILRPNSNQKHCSCLSVDDMGIETVEAAKKIISRKLKSNAEEDYELLMHKIKNIEKQLSCIGTFENKLDTILRKIS